MTHPFNDQGRVVFHARLITRGDISMYVDVEPLTTDADGVTPYARYDNKWGAPPPALGGGNAAVYLRIKPSGFPGVITRPRYMNIHVRRYR